MRMRHSDVGERTHWIPPWDRDSGRPSFGQYHHVSCRTMRPLGPRSRIPGCPRSRRGSGYEGGEAGWGALLRRLLRSADVRGRWRPPEFSVVRWPQATYEVTASRTRDRRGLRALWRRGRGPRAAQPEYGLGVGVGPFSQARRERRAGRDPVQRHAIDSRISSWAPLPCWCGRPHCIGWCFPARKARVGKRRWMRG